MEKREVYWVYKVRSLAEGDTQRVRGFENLNRAIDWVHDARDKAPALLRYDYLIKEESTGMTVFVAQG